MSWEDLSSEVAELFAELSPVSIFDLDRYAPKGGGCEWPRCGARKSGRRYCATHQAAAIAQTPIDRAARQQASHVRVMAAIRRCKRCDRGVAVAWELCVTCAREHARYRWLRRTEAA